MSAAEDDTELRDLLLQNLENSGVLHKLKAQIRAAVFLAMEEQDRLENKSPLVNQNLKKCLNTKDGRLVAALVMDFLQVFDLDFTLSVFEPETNAKPLETVNRELLCKDLGLEPNPKSPILLELVQRRIQDRTKDQNWVQTKQLTPVFKTNQEPTEKQLQLLRKRFDFYDRDNSGSVNQDDVKRVFCDLFPQMNRTVLEQFTVEELTGSALRGSTLRDSALRPSCDWTTFLQLYHRLYSQCCSVVIESGDGHEKLHPDNSQTSEPKEDSSRDPRPGLTHDSRPQRDPVAQQDLEDVDEGDSFFDDPLPAPQKTYGCSEDLAPNMGLRRDKSLSGKPESPVPSLSLGQSPSSPPTGSSKNREKGRNESRSNRSGSQLRDADVEYDDDFNSHRSDLSHSELSIGEEIEEVSIEGPEPSDQMDETTQDLSLSQISHTADYMEDVP